MKNFKTLPILGDHFWRLGALCNRCAGRRHRTLCFASAGRDLDWLFSGYWWRNWHPQRGHEVESVAQRHHRDLRD